MLLKLFTNKYVHVRKVLLYRVILYSGTENYICGVPYM